MTIESFLRFVMRYNTVLVEVLITSILVCAAYLSYRLFKAERDSELGVSGGADLSNLEGLLQSVIEKANLVPTGGAAGDHAASEKLAEQISTLKMELEKKQSEIENMKGAAGAQSEGGGMTAEEKKNLEAQMLELQRKLEEYDIIAQDIADLSFYKEENQRLQRELESKGGASKAAPPGPTPTSAAAETVISTKAPMENMPSPESSIMPSAIEEKPEGKVLNMETRAESPASPEVTAPEISIPAAAIDDIVTSVAMEKTPDLQEGPISDADMAQFSAEVVKQTASTQPEADNFINDDLMKDWESTVAEQEKTGALAEPDVLQATKPTVAAASPATEGNPLEGSMDLDKMAQEAGGLSEAPSDSSPTIDPSSHELDPEKLAAEADKLVASSGGIKNDMDEFQKFISKDKGS
jgi:hypothetical protein